MSMAIGIGAVVAWQMAGMALALKIAGATVIRG